MFSLFMASLCKIKTIFYLMVSILKDEFGSQLVNLLFNFHETNSFGITYNFLLLMSPFSSVM